LEDAAVREAREKQVWKSNQPVNFILIPTPADPRRTRFDCLIARLRESRARDDAEREEFLGRELPSLSPSITNKSEDICCPEKRPISPRRARRKNKIIPSFRENGNPEIVVKKTGFLLRRNDRPF